MSIRAIIILNICIVSFCFQNGIAQSPYQLDWKNEPYYLGAGVVTFGVGYISTSQAEGLTGEEIAAHDRNDVNKFDRGATYNSSYSAKTASDILWASSYLVPLSLLALKDTRRDFGKISILYGETVLISTGFTYFIKVVAFRSRPLVYNEAFSLVDKQKVSSTHSYFSGHTSITSASLFFTAKVFSDYYPDSKFKPYVWAGAVVIPAMVGYFRVAAGKHFPTDVITGYVVGATIGILIPHFHRKIKIGNADSSIKLSVGLTGASLNWRLN